MNKKLEFKDFINMFGSFGDNFYLVGGCLRNLRLNKPVKDWDIATHYAPEELLRMLCGSKMINAAQAYPVVHWNGLEIATFRSDGNDRRDASGIRIGASMEEDAMRRDFTMNSLYAPIKNPTRCIDLTGHGINDIDNKRIRFVGDPEQRIFEDPLRVLRAYRFQAQLGFTFEEKTEKALKGALLKMSFR